MSTLTQIIINWLIDHAAPAYPDDAPTQDTLATCFFPFAANTSSPEDNARLSWALEMMLRMYFDANRNMCSTPELVDAVEKGILAREKRVKAKGGAKGEGAEMYKQQMLESAWRMRVLLEAVAGAMEGKVRKDVEGAESEEEEVDRDDPVTRAKEMADLEAEWEALDS